MRDRISRHRDYNSDPDMSPEPNGSTSHRGGAYNSRRFSPSPDRAPHGDRDHGDRDHDHHSSYNSRKRSHDSFDDIDSEYRTLCLTNWNENVSDKLIQESLYREFEDFGEFNVKIIRVGLHGNRIAYLNFCYPQDAVMAKTNRANGLMLFDRPIRAEPVRNTGKRYYKSQNRGSSPPFRQPFRGRPPFRSRGGGGGRGGFRDNFYHQSRFHNSHGGSYSSHRGNYDGHYKPRYFNDHPRYNNRNYHHDLDYSDKSFHNKSQDTNLSPEDDHNATRTLFVGNLDGSLDAVELHRVFSRYGNVEDVDIKRPPRGVPGNSYAFVRFQDLDMAHDAKVSMAGKHIGKYQCKIGYGKVIPSPCLWVGGLGSWCHEAMLEKAFGKYGLLRKIVLPRDSSKGLVLFEDIRDAKAACHNLRGYELDGHDRRIRVDFGDERHMEDFGEPLAKKRRRSMSRDKSNSKKYDDDDNDSSPRSPHYIDDEDDENRESDDDILLKRERSESRERSPPEILDKVRTIEELNKYLQVAWSGDLVLKSSSFAGLVSLVAGNVRLVDKLMKDTDESERPVLKINQRLRMDEAKLNDIRRRLESSGMINAAILVAQGGGAHSERSSSEYSQRPLKNLVSYLKQKEAAGVVSLPPYPSEVSGVLHAFPPCEFSNELLQHRAPNIEPPSKENYLVLLLMKGTV